MSKIVREHYPVANLPDDLKVELGAAEAVRIEIEPEFDAARPITVILDEARRLRASGGIRSLSEAEVMARIHRLRDD